MTIKIESTLEPFTDAALRAEVKPVLAESQATRRFEAALRRYVKGEITGRAYLVAGHRGSGKTTLVLHAISKIIFDATRPSEDGGDDTLFARPLLVRLNGPDLLQSEESAWASNLWTSAGADEVGRTKHVLTQITAALYKGLVAEFAGAFRQHANRARSESDRAEWFEIAAHLRLELDSSPHEARLRELWNRVEAVRTGVLFLRPRQPDQGLREITALSSAAQAYRVVSATVTEQASIKDDATAESKLERKPQEGGKELISSLIGLASGITAGAALAAAKTDGPYAALGGVITGLLTLLGLNYTSTRSRKRVTDSSLSITRDRSVASLSRMLPDLVSRVRDAGLVPVFVVDELDKLETKLPALIVSLINRLKHFVTEQGFFCFLTDRTYLEYVEQERRKAYAKEYTYFSDRLLVAYQPEDLRKYLGSIVKVGSTDKSEELTVRVLQYVLLHRSRLHPFDLRNLVDDQRGEGGELRELPLAIGRFPRTRCEVTMQVAIEFLLGHEPLKSRCEADDAFWQFTRDALYLASRLWEKGEPVPPLTVEYLRGQLADRLGTEHPPGGAAREISITTSDQVMLVGRCARLVDYLLDPTSLVADIAESKRLVDEQKDPAQTAAAAERYPDDILEFVLQGRPLLQRNDGLFRWRYDYFGREIEDGQTVDMQSTEFGESINLLQEYAAFWASLKQTGIDATTVAEEYGLMPRTPYWSSVAEALRVAKDVRGGSPASAVRRSGQSGGERDIIQQYDRLVRENLASVALAIFCGSIVGIAQAEGNAPDALSAGLRRVSAGLQLKGLSSTETRKRLTSLANELASLTEVDAPQGTVVLPTQHSVELWTTALNQMLNPILPASWLDSLNRGQLIANAWERWRERFRAQVMTATSTIDLASASELLCDALEIGPSKQVGSSKLLSSPLAQITLAGWGAAFSCGLRRDGGGDEIRCPWWLSSAVAGELGFGDAAKGLANALLARSPDAHASAEISWSDLMTSRPPRGEPRSGSLVILRDKETRQGRRTAPQRHASLALTGEELTVVAKRLGELDCSLHDLGIRFVLVETDASSRKSASVVFQPQFGSLVPSGVQWVGLVDEDAPGTRLDETLGWIASSRDLDDVLDGLKRNASSPS